MRITNQQLDVLDSLVVERLGSNVDNTTIVETFNNSKNPTLTDIIKDSRTLDKDRSGTTAYYVVKTHKGELLMYFSLKCGELFEVFDIGKIQFAVETIKALNVVLKGKHSSTMSVPEAEAFINNHLKEIKEILPNLQFYISKKGQYTLDLERELNSDIRRVMRTYPAIELVEFCSNDNAKPIWDKLGLPPSKKMGECVFWHIILKKISEAQKLIGCQYVYLFAADSSTEGYLINYYKVVLKFVQPLGLGANKPAYDFACSFMCQDINVLKTEREMFYETFNSDDSLINQV